MLHARYDLEVLCDAVLETQYAFFFYFRRVYPSGIILRFVDQCCKTNWLLYETVISSH